MNSSISSYSVPGKFIGGSRIVPLLRRAPLVMVSVIFTLIGLRYLIDPQHAAAAAGISFSSPGGITVARVGFGAFPIVIAILAFACLISSRWLLPGLYMVFTLATVVIAVRLFSMVVDHSAESARLLAPETILLTLSVLGIRLGPEDEERES
jgi:hypothetical protein